MDVYDLTKNLFVPLSYIAKRIEKYEFYYNGKEILLPTLQKIDEIVSNESKKIIQQQKISYIIVKEKEKVNTKNSSIEGILSKSELSQNFSENYLKIIKQDPSALFFNRNWNFQYMREKSQNEVSRQQYEYLRDDLLNNSRNWKEASLQELEAVSKNRNQIFKNTLKQ